jgi:diacylglycerol kinase (ATP)
MRLVIANPTSCGGKAIETLEQFSAFLRQKGLPFLVYNTKPENNTPEIRQLISKHSIENITILGGDGTINIVLNALPHLNFSLHLIPAGTGNDLAKMLYKEVDEESTFKLAIVHTNLKKIDSWKCNEHRFCNGFGAGFDGEIAHRMYQKKYWLPSKLKYWIEIFRLIFSYRSTEVEINGTKTDVFMLAAANGKVYGGGFNIAPLAIADDGLLEIVKIGKVPVLKRFLYLPKIEKGVHLDLDVIDYKRQNSLEIKSEKPLPAHLEGEPILATHYNITKEGQLTFVI